MKKTHSHIILSLLFAIIFSLCSFAQQEFDFGQAIAVQASDEACLSQENIIPVVHGRTKEEIVEMHKSLTHVGFGSFWTQPRFNTQPMLTAPYNAGQLKSDDIKDAENALKMVRYLAGVPYEDVEFTSELNSISQHGAAMMASSGQFSHYPLQPEDMSDSFFALAYRGCNEANIHMGVINLSYGVLGFAYDGGQNNVAHVGHRRWLLNPGNQKFGIGQASGDYGARGSIHCQAGLGPWDCESDSYIAWPSAGDFPIQYFVASSNTYEDSGSPWSINLGAPYDDPSKDSVVVTLTRQSDGRVWIFDKDTPDLFLEELEDNTLPDDKMHLAVDSHGYGIRKAIVFRPDPDSLGNIEDGEVFKVEVTGIKTAKGVDTSLEYEVSFFDLEKELLGYKPNFYIYTLCDFHVLSDVTITVDREDKYDYGNDDDDEDDDDGDNTYTTDSTGRLALCLEPDTSYICDFTKEDYGELLYRMRSDDEFVSYTIHMEYLGEVTGDVNKDRAVDIDDAILLFQHSMMPDIYTLKYAGSVDFDKDGQITIDDAIFLFQHSMMPDVYPLD